jgi:hypothetical protein
LSESEFKGGNHILVKAEVFKLQLSPLLEDQEDAANSQRCHASSSNLDSANKNNQYSPDWEEFDLNDHNQAVHYNTNYFESETYSCIKSESLKFRFNYCNQPC